MVSAISNATETQAAAQPTKTQAEKPAQPAPKSATSADSVQLSQVAQAIAAALQETKETAAQTAQEAASGDLPAQRLLAREAATKSG
jgi:hypothetical protein